jgi:ATP-dependent helicase YprA (DUF1998 family)
LSEPPLVLCGDIRDAAVFDAFTCAGNRTCSPVTADLVSLVPHGFPSTFVEALRRGIPSLNDLQLQAVNDMRLFEGEHLVVSAPTSSGKTMICSTRRVL